MNWRRVWAVVRKDLKVALQNKSVTLPLILVPLLLFVVLPSLAVFLPSLINLPTNSPDELQQLLARAPALRDALAGYDEMQGFVVYFLVYMMLPLFLLVPIMVSNVIAADSFVGEKERKTLEALLYTPATDTELVLGKMLAAWLPALAVSWIGFALYTVVVNLLGWSAMGRVFFPNVTWVVTLLWVAPAAAGFGLAAMVLVSARSKTFQDAYQLGSLVVVPIILLVLGQATGVMFLSLALVVILGAVLWIIDLLLLRYSSKNFRRGELIARL